MMREELAVVPGIGKKCVKLLGADNSGSISACGVDDAAVTKVSELVGVFINIYILLAARGAHTDSAKQNFFIWLKEVKFVSSHRHDIVRAIAERADIIMFGVNTTIIMFGLVNNDEGNEAHHE